MAAKRLTMKSIKQLFKMRFEAQLSQRKVARALRCGKTTIAEYELRAREQGITTYADVCALTEEELLNALGLRGEFAYSNFPLRKAKHQPDWNWVHHELKAHKHTTLALLWEEYIEQNPGGYSYSQFCEHYRRWRQKLSVTLRQEHRAGEKVFVDYAGSTVDIVDPNTGEVHAAQIFVAVLGASSYTYCEATWTQQLPDWITSNRRMLEFFGGVPEILVPDNLPSGVKKPDRYEAEINPTYQEFAEHYGCCVIPARKGKSRDKAKAEAGVLYASRWILAALRNKTFHSLEELNEAIWRLLEKLNNRKMRYVQQSRCEMFENLDKPALGKLRSQPYNYAEWKKATVNIDYHIELEGHFYSVPYQLTRQKVWVRSTPTTVEIFFKTKRVASHQRSFRKGQHTTDPSHRPASHHAHLEWTPSRIINWGNSKGGWIAEFIEKLIYSKPHPEQGYRAALGIIRLADQYGTERLNDACEKAIGLNTLKYKAVHNMLKNGMEKPEGVHKKQELVNKEFFTSNENVRGKEYYH